MFLDGSDPRTTVSLGLRLVATERVPAGDNEFEPYARELGDRAEAVLRAQGLRAVPRFPGKPLAQAPPSNGERRTLFVADIWRGDELIGMAITSLIAGRVPNISVAPACDPPTIG